MENSTLFWLSNSGTSCTNLGASTRTQWTAPRLESSQLPGESTLQAGCGLNRPASSRAWGSVHGHGSVTVRKSRSSLAWSSQLWHQTDGSGTA